MLVEIWSDIGCPWCFIGKRRFEAALSRFEHAPEVEVRWRSYQLDPSLPERFEGSEVEYLSKVKGMDPAQVSGMLQHVTEQAAGVGLDYRFGDLKVANTFTAHRLIHLARDLRGAQTAAAVKEALLAAHFEQGQDISSHDVLAGIGADAGLDPDTVREVLSGTEYTDSVNADIAEGRALGVSGVPFFVLDRKYGISGAQPEEVFAQALTQAWAESHQPLQPVVSEGGACAVDGSGC
ncbi:DsbA family oxidoreductase [Arthrobacter caoxuetaonis]|uniref:DsbA family oxidoreductase n=1 Tax=Arthrobacter caoxuetaonis TaxID=2886935 RepID=UPI001D14F4F5|nr:DsbA family oxidoreductase [Arthrobacter caoxuetaonis]